MYLMLNALDKYMKEKGIKFRRIQFSYEYLPKYLNFAITYVLRAIDSNGNFSQGPEYYTLFYDENDVLHLEVMTDDHKKRLLICSNPLGFSTKTKADIITERRLLEGACILKELRPKQLAVRQELAEKYPDKPYIERLKLEYNIMTSLAMEEINLREENDDSILKYVDTKAMLEDSVRKIIGCIEEANRAYQEDIKKRDTVINIQFNSSNDEGESRCFPLGVGHGSKERINEVIPEDERDQILRTHHYIFFGNGCASEYGKSDYLCYLYKISHDRYILILEPKSGTNYTRMVVIESKQWIDRNEFAQLVKKYLEKSSQEILASKNAIRTTHTTLDIFRENIAFAVTGEDRDGGCGPYVRKKIKEIREKK